MELNETNRPLTEVPVEETSAAPVLLFLQRKKQKALRRVQRYKLRKRSYSA